MRLRVALVSIVVPTLVLLGGLQGTSQALADYRSHPVFQLGISANCNNPSLCGQFLGGFWGWAVFNLDGTVDAEFAGCGHLQNGGGPGTAGAEHFSADAEQWRIGGNGDFWVKDETDTYTGRNARTEFIPGWQDAGIPAAPGHHSTEEMFGFTGPGVSFQVQVARVPHWADLYFGTTGHGVTSGSVGGSVGSNSAPALRRGAVAGSTSASRSASAWSASWARFGHFYVV